MAINGEPPVRNLIIALVIIALAIGGGAVILLSSEPDPVEIVINPPIPTLTPEPTAVPGPMLVYVTGAVNNPQITIELPVGSHVQDAINAAGGLLPNADLDRVNLAGIVRDGDLVHVYALGEANPVVLPTDSGGGLVYINSATVEEIQTLPGIGPVIAQRILDYRLENGPFVDVNALQNVPGIGPATLENVSAFIVID